MYTSGHHQASRNLPAEVDSPGAAVVVLECSAVPDSDSDSGPARRVALMTASETTGAEARNSLSTRYAVDTPQSGTRYVNAHVAEALLIAVGLGVDGARGVEGDEQTNHTVVSSVAIDLDGVEVVANLDT